MQADEDNNVCDNEDENQEDMVKEPPAPAVLDNLSNDPHYHLGQNSDQLNLKSSRFGCQKGLHGQSKCKLTKKIMSKKKD